MVRHISFYSISWKTWFTTSAFSILWKISKKGNLLFSFIFHLINTASQMVVVSYLWNHKLFISNYFLPCCILQWTLAVTINS